MYEKYLEQLEEAGKIRNLKERSINCYKNYVSYFLKYQGKCPEELTCQDVRTFLLAKKEEGMNYPAASCGVSKVATSTYNPICYTALFSLRFYRLFYNFFPVPVLSHIYL